MASSHDHQNSQSPLNLQNKEMYTKGKGLPAVSIMKSASLIYKKILYLCTFFKISNLYKIPAISNWGDIDWCYLHTCTYTPVCVLSLSCMSMTIKWWPSLSPAGFRWKMSLMAPTSSVTLTKPLCSSGSSSPQSLYEAQNTSERVGYCFSLLSQVWKHWINCSHALLDFHFLPCTLQADHALIIHHWFELQPRKNRFHHKTLYTSI